MIEYYGGATAIQLLDTFDIERLNKLLVQTKELRRTPEDRKQEKRAKVSAALSQQLKEMDLSQVEVTRMEDDGTVSVLTLEQINNFDF